MSTPEGTHRSPWIWVSAVLVVVAAGLLIWALTLQSGKNDAEQDVAELQAQTATTDAAASGSGGIAAVIGPLVQGLAQQLGATNEDLAQVEQELEQAQKDAQAAAEEAEQQVEDSKEQAEAQADAAEAKLGVVSGCAKAYLSAFSTLFQGDSVTAQAAAIRGQLQGITATCKEALAGT
jgi:hypothetical protein